MLHLLLKLAFLLNTLLTLVVGIIQAVPHDDNQLHAFITDPENCAGSCLMGIRPGETTVGEALEYLQTHAWVESFQLSAPGTGYGQIRWQWSGWQPASIDDSQPGRITFYWDEDEPHTLELNDMPVETISINTRMSMFSLQDWFGKPDSGTAGIRPDGALGYSAAYHWPGTTLSLSTTIPCPVSLMSYWNAWAKLSLSIGQGTSDYVAPFAMVDIC